MTTEDEHVTMSRDIYDHSANLFVAAVGTRINDRFESDFDRALLHSFAERVAAHSDGPVLDIGCGPGRVAAFLAGYGIDASGIDISSKMIDVAQTAHPELHFEVGTLTDLPVGDQTLAAGVLWYSIITTPPAGLTAAWTELRRALSDESVVLVAFQAGLNDVIEQPDAYGSGAVLRLIRHEPANVADSMRAAGFEVIDEFVRPAEFAHETTPQAFVIACPQSKPA
jgi:ubiquinone/menaquinone biosynthesis C-methylase UbiE